jgi:hypothetical protein
MCLVETDKTVKEVWSKVNQECKSFKETCLISERSDNNLWGDFKPVELSPLKYIKYIGLVEYLVKITKEEKENKNF